ncbi:transient receptor potential cation channel subfamily M member 2-like isoform X2 [Biomphalaria glabrata]|nr:transient receptor potential cation channel subfamily M member 2-like isoform X2 [Biomphalaria glabrata]
MSLFKTVMQAARNETEKIYCGWSNNRHATILRCSSITTDDIKLDDLPKYKLYVRLRLPEQAIPGFLLRKFVNSLLKTMKYDECLIFELNDAVASAICNELKFQEKTPLGILQDDVKKSKISISGRHICNLPMRCQLIRLNEKGNEKSVIYSYFKRLLLVPSLEQFKIDLAEDIYACDIIFKATKSVTGINNFARVYVEPASAALRYISLTFEEALDYEVLGRKIYEEVKRHYKITEGSKESFLLKMSLKCLNDKIPSQLNWSLEDIKDVVNVAVKDHRTTSLAQLLEGFDTKDKILLLLKEGYGLDESIIDKKETVLLRKLLRNVHIKMNLDKQNGCMLLFINALVHKKFKASLFYWTQLDNLIGSALIASYFLKKCTNTEQDQAGLTKLKEYQNFYQDLAIGTLFACYKENILSTWILLIQQIPVWGNESCITIAMKTKNRQFVQQKACSDLNKYVWNNYKGLQLQDLEPESVFKTDETVAASKVKENIERFFLSPKGRCRLDSIGYILFLTAYSILLVSLLSAQQFHWLEGVVMFYMFIIIAREIDQVFQERGEYQLEIYNIFDLLSITLAVIAWTLRWVAYHYTDYPQIMDAARYVFSCDFIVYALRFTEYFYENKMLGPILVKIRKMVKIYIPFLFILFIFLVSYAVASESILYPETELNRYILYYIFRKGFWAMIGDYRLDEVEVSGDGCTRDPNLYRNHSVLRCPSISGRFAMPVFLGAYALFVQILMFSLIIALFNFAITRKEEQNEMIWRYQRFLLSEQYSRCRILLPPFIPLFFWLMFRVGQPYSSSFEESEAHSGIKEFENMAGQIITGKIIDGSFTTINDDYFSDGDDDFNPNIGHQDSRRASSIRKLNAGSRYRLSPRLTRRLRQSEKISKTESDESNGLYVNVEALPIPTLKDIIDEIKEEDETSFQESDGHVTPSSETPGLNLSSPGAFHEQFSFLTQEATKQKKKAAKKSTELPSLPALFNTMERDVLY